MSIVQQLVLDQVWCTPGQDEELILKPNRLHGAVSIYAVLPYLDRQIVLPSKTSSWYVYQIGTYYESPDQLPLSQFVWEEEVWRPMTEPLINRNLFTSLFTQSGLVFPLFRAYYMYTREKALLLAVEHNNLIAANLATEDLYVRFYRNAFYDSTRSIGTDYGLKTDGVILTSPSDITGIVNTINTLTAARGYCWLTINGRRFKNPTPAFVSAGDYVEYIYDPTVDHVDSIPLGNLLSYMSTEDSEQKRVLHPLALNYFTSIAYQDDLTIDLLTPISDTGQFGVNYPAIADKVRKMLTHRDYALRSSLLTSLTAMITELNPSSRPIFIVVEVKYRKSGYERPLLKTTSLVDDLYTLPMASIPAHISSIASSFPTFYGPSMETSPYIRAMKAQTRDDLTASLAESAIGYNGIANYYGTVVQKVTINGSNKTVPVPTGYQANCTAYEYNFSGQYLEYHLSQGQSVYTAIHVNGYYIELIKGIASNQPAARYGFGNLVYNTGFGHRVYACSAPGGTPSFVWTDITETNDYTIDHDNALVKFTNPADTRYMMVRDDSQFVVSSTSPIFNTCLMSMQIVEQVDRGLGAGYEDLPMAVPPTDIEVILNTKGLVRNIDYFVEFPYIYISNIKYLNQTVENVNQFLHVRTCGLGSGTTDIEPTLDSGNVVHGFVGTSGKYVAKNDKNLRITIDGLLKLPSTVKFSQDDATTTDPTNTLNAMTYQVKAYPVSIQEYVDGNQELMRKDSKQLDADLVTYMDSHFTFINRGLQTNAVGVYSLVCPFHAKIIDDLINNVFTNSDIDPSKTDSQIQAIIAPYLHYLQNGPCNAQYGLINNPYFKIVPHARTSLVFLGSTDKLNFFTRVSQLNVGNVIDITNVTF